MVLKTERETDRYRDRDKLGEKDQHIVHTLTHKVTLKQAGFAYLECGSVRSKNATNILIKNLLDALFGALSYWLVGFAFAYGDDNHEYSNEFIGLVR